MTQVLSEKKMFSEDEIAQLLQHVIKMIGPYGLYQHATRQSPLLSEGYCTDDNARAVQVLVRLKKLAAPAKHQLIEELLVGCWKFIVDAEENPGLFYNFRSADGAWLPQGRSDDMYARLFRALANVLTFDSNNDRRQAARAMLPALVDQIKNLRAPRFLAESIIAVSELPTADQPAHSNQLNRWLEQLRQLWHSNATPAWPWFEPTMTYANALFPHSFLRGLPLNDHSDNKEILKKSADFLIATTIHDGIFIPIGSNGWYQQGQAPSQNNQQPIEAGLMFDFLLDYQKSGAPLSTDTILAPYLWLFGKNTHHFALVDESQGICRDGLLASGPNLNCGAESLLAYLWAEVRLKDAPDQLQEIAYQERKKIVATK